MTAQPDWLTSGPAARALALLDCDGEEARVVGGAVRNHLLGLAPGDIDVATTAVPAETMRRAREAGLKVAPTGVEHGTVTVVADGVGVEVTTLRRDIDTDGRRAVVQFGRDWREDAARRDFTFNAMSLDRSGAIFDYFSGRADLDRRHVRFIGDPATRIAEDRLRILRFFRFHAAYGAGAMNAAGLSACIAARDELEALSRERVRQETMKLLVAPGACETIEIMSDCGLLGRLIGGVAALSSLRRLTEIEVRLGLAPDATRRLAALAVRIEEDAQRLRDRLRLSNAEDRRCASVAHGWRALDPAHGEAAAKAALYAAGPRSFVDRALVAFARSDAAIDDRDWAHLVDLPKRWAAPGFPVNGDDLARRGLAPGPAMGEALARIKAAWIAADFPVRAEAVARLVDAALAQK